MALGGRPALPVAVFPDILLSLPFAPAARVVYAFCDVAIMIMPFIISIKINQCGTIKHF